MANDGDSGDGLPDSDDPYVLLGIPRDADARAVRRAYARLIKRYRPDRAPEEFRRIHAAFESITAGARMRPHVHHDDLEDAPAPEHGREPASSRWQPFDDALRARDLPGALAAIDNPELVSAAALDAALAGRVLDRLVALAWRFEVPSELLARYRGAFNNHVELGSAVESANVELALANQVRGRELPGLLVGLDDLMVALRLSRYDEIAEHGRTLCARITAAGTSLLREVMTLQTRYPAFAGTLTEVLAESIPALASRLDRLPPAQFETLTHELHAVGRRPWRWAVRGVVAGTHYVGWIAAGIGGVLTVAAVAWVVLLVGERVMYERAIRPGVARAIATARVPVPAVVRWIRINRRLAGRLTWFDLMIEQDRALVLVGLLVALVDWFEERP